MFQKFDAEKAHLDCICCKKYCFEHAIAVVFSVFDMMMREIPYHPWLPH